MMMVSTSPSNGRAWDRSVLAGPSTPSARFAQDITAGVKARAWVEEVIGRRLPEGEFAAGFKDGVGLCELMNVLQPGTITKIEKSASPFHQMANISCFLKACRALGVREQVLFETLDLFNENRLSQVVRCLFSLSELVRTTMPSYRGPYLAAPERPQADPAVLHLVDLSKGNVVPAPGWGGPVTPGAVSIASTGGASTGGAAAQMLSLPNPVEEEVTSSGCCLSPAAHRAGQLTYGIYEGGGATAKTPPAISPVVRRVRGRQAEEEEQQQQQQQQGVAAASAEGEEAEAEEILQPQAEENQAYRAAGVAGDGGGRVATVAETALPVANTPRIASSRIASSRDPMGSGWKTLTIAAPREGGGGGGGGSAAAGGKGFASGSLEEQAKRRREATARSDTEMEVALWIEGTTGETFPGKFWSSLKDGVLLCKLINSIRPGLIPHINTSHGTFPELENITAFLGGCRKVGVAEHSLFDTKDLHEKRDMQVVVHCLHVLGAAVQSTVPEFMGPFLGKKSDALSIVNARGLRKRLGKGPGARGGIHTLTAHKGVGPEHVSSGDLPPIEHPDPTATMTPAESPSAKWARRREASDSAAESGGGGKGAPASPRAMAEGLNGALLPAVILEEEAGMASAAVRVEREGKCGARVVEEAIGGGGGGGRRNLGGLFAESGRAATPREGGGGGGGARVLRRGVSGPADSQRRRRAAHRQHEEEDGGEGVASQIQRFVELHTQQPWRVGGDMHESLRDGWQLALLANTLRPGAVRRVHNSIQPAKQVQNIASFLIACRRMGVARVLLFDIEDLYENKSQTRVARTLLALRVLAADPDFARARPSSLMGTSLLVTAAALAKEKEAKGTASTTSTDVKR